MAQYGNYSTNEALKNMRESMMTKEEFSEFSSGISEDLHSKVKSIKNSFGEGVSKALTGNLLTTVIIVALMLWVVITSTAMVNSVNQEIEEVKTQVSELSSYLQSMTAELEGTIAEIENQIDTLETEVGILKTEIKQFDTEVTELAETVVTIKAELEKPAPVVINYSDITHRSNLTAEQWDTIINSILEKYGKGTTQLTGLGQALYDMEAEYDINGFLALGISGIESGWGTSAYARNHNNLYGLLGMSFDSTYDCTMYFGKLMREGYIGQGRTSLSSISNKYCNSNEKWVKDVSWFIGIYSDMAKSLYAT